MFFKGISLGSLIIVFLLVMMLFGTKRLREIGTDLGAAIKNFKKGIQEEDQVLSNDQSIPDNK